MAQIQIIIGTVMGTALEVAEAIAAVLEGCGHQVRLNSQFQAGQLEEDPNEILLLCTSNTGMGDLPANIAPLHVHLTNDYPVVAGRRYGLITLGDSSYPNFAQAGTTLDEAMMDLGAVRIGDPFVIDAIVTSDPAEDASTWIMGWEQHL